MALVCFNHQSYSYSTRMALVCFNHQFYSYSTRVALVCFNHQSYSYSTRMAIAINVKHFKAFHNIFILQVNGKIIIL